MKRSYTLSVLSALILGACQNENIVVDLPESSIFYATIEDNNTKTSLDENGSVLWKQGDQVNVFNGCTINKQYQVTDASDDKTSATLNIIDDGGYAAGIEIDNNVAFYPYSAGNSVAKTMDAGIYNITCTLPATQTYSAGSFGNGAFPMVAVTGSTEENNFSFKNVLGGLKLQLMGTTSIRSISVTGNNDEILCGTAIVTAQKGGTPTIAMTDSSAKKVTLNCGAGVQLNTTTATAFIIALPPMTMTGGFTVLVTDTEGKQMEIKTTRSQSISRSSLLRMPAVNYSGVYGYVDLGLPSGVKWAYMNIGATAPEGYGDYFAWGATTPHNGLSYSWDNAPYQDAVLSEIYNYSAYHLNYESTKWSKYVGSTTSSYRDTEATDWNNGMLKTVLSQSDDAAHANWGGNWRMPTDTEWKELLENCTWTWTTLNGIKGYKVQSKKNDNWIFLPAAGNRNYTCLDNKGTSGTYWSCSLDPSAPYYAMGMSLYSGLCQVTKDYRAEGLSVRPVLSDVQNCGITGISLDNSYLQFAIPANYSDTGIESTNNLTATVSKNNGAVNTQVEWSSSNPKVAIVDYSGTVTVISTGTATITAKTVYADFSADCRVEVVIDTHRR